MEAEISDLKQDVEDLETALKKVDYDVLSKKQTKHVAYKFCVC